MNRLLTLLLLVAFCKVHAQQYSSSKIHVIDSLLERCYVEDMFNGVALVVDSGKIILHKAYGVSEEGRIFHREPRTL